MIENAITVEIGSSFFLNAGICGLIRFLLENDAEEGFDYEIGEQTLSVSVDYLKENNIHDMYIKTISNLLGKNTKHYRVMNDGKAVIDRLNSLGVENLDEKQQKDLKDEYTKFCAMMLKSGYISAYKLTENMVDVQPINSGMIEELRKCEDLKEKYEKYNKVVELVNQPKVNSLLIYTELVYGQLKMFFSEISSKQKWVCLRKKDEVYEKTYYDIFFSPLLNELEIDDKKKKISCIECRGIMSAKSKKSLSFLADTVDDLNKKKSYYWNLKPDAYVCPTCAFVYSFVPLGFAFMGSEAVFINNNSSVWALYKVMNTCRAKADDETNSVRRRVMRTLTAEKIDELNNVMSNVQVIMNSSEFSHFKFEIIDKDMVKKLKLGQKYLSYLEKKKVSFDGKNTISVYDTTLDNIYGRRSLYYLLDRLLKFELGKNGRINYLKGLLRLAVIFNGGTQMDDLNKKVDIAFNAGRSLRKSILGNDADKAESEEDNRLRGFVYRLVNLASVGDRAQFIDTVVRIYSGHGLAMPAIFKDCYVSDEMFKAIAHGFIIGLKYVPYKDNKEENKNG